MPESRAWRPRTAVISKPTVAKWQLACLFFPRHEGRIRDKVSESMSWKERLVQCRELREASDGDMRQMMNTMGLLSDHLSSAPADSSTEQLNETMNALRTAHCCLSVEETRRDVQREMVVLQNMHVSLFELLSQKNFPPKKPQILAAQLLCNLVTRNAETASKLMNDLPLSPSEEEIEARLLQLTTAPCGGEEQQSRHDKCNWMDMMLNVCSSNRDALGAVVAALHNALSVLHGHDWDERRWSLGVAVDGRLVATLLRHMLPSSKATATIEEESTADTATEWISLLIEGLCRWGYLEHLLDSAAGGSPKKMIVIVPEHLVLLHCIASAVDAWTRDCTSNTEAGPHPLGGEGNANGILTSHRCLTDFALRARQTAMGTGPGMAEKDEVSLGKTSQMLVYEILGNSLGNDRSVDLAHARQEVGRSLVVVLGEDLRQMVDVLTQQQQSNQGASSRELKLSSEEQHWMTTVVRLMGNLCFRCPRNQNLMRTTISEPEREQQQQQRTILHVLLSCTSFAYGCFTLREWAIVAIRNALEANDENQALVRELEAQQPLQNAELANMGMKVAMDRNGKVRVVPTDDARTA